jgi:hypothetical protein
MPGGGSSGCSFTWSSSGPLRELDQVLDLRGHHLRGSAPPVEHGLIEHHPQPDRVGGAVEAVQLGGASLQAEGQIEPGRHRSGKARNYRSLHPERETGPDDQDSGAMKPC